MEAILASRIQAAGLAYQMFVPALVEVLGLSIRDDEFDHEPRTRLRRFYKSPLESIAR